MKYNSTLDWEAEIRKLYTESIEVYQYCGVGERIAWVRLDYPGKGAYMGKIMDIKLIISITSHPMRIGMVSKVIKSLFKQSQKADKIILWLSIQEFPKREENLPEELVSLIGLNGFQIRWVMENLRSHKKYYYVLQEYSKDIVITVDDDNYYASTMVEELLKAYYKFPNAVSARRVHFILRQGEKIADYNKWYDVQENIKMMERTDLIAIGVGGILYPPRISSKRWFNIDTIEKLSPDQDDLWLKFNEILDGIPVVYTGHVSMDESIEEIQHCALFKTNIIQNDISINKLYLWGKMQNDEMMEKWICSLCQYTSYYEEQRKKHILQLQKILDSNKRKRIYICGAGKYARALINLFTTILMQEKIEGILVSGKYNNPMEINGIPVMLINDVEIDENVLIICGVGEKNKRELMTFFIDNQCNWLEMELWSIFKCFGSNI